MVRESFFRSPCSIFDRNRKVIKLDIFAFKVCSIKTWPLTSNSSITTWKGRKGEKREEVRKGEKEKDWERERGRKRKAKNKQRERERKRDRERERTAMDENITGKRKKEETL